MIVINLTSGPRENTETATPKNLMMFENQHIVILVDETTLFMRIIKLQDVLKDIALTTKVVDSDYTNQWLLTHNGFTL